MTHRWFKRTGDLRSVAAGQAPPVRPTTPIANNAWLCSSMFLGAEAMFFAGLIGAFLVFRIASPVLAAAVSAAPAVRGYRD